MKMRKNTKSNPSYSNRGLDVLVVALSLLIIFISLFLFLRNLNKTFVRTDRTPVATVTFKYKSVQRKFLDRAIWDRPLQHSPVYNGDTIRTSPDAEATLYFVDRNVVELGSNTMIQVFVNSEESRVDLDTGSLSVETSLDNGMLVSSKNTQAAVSKGSVFRADKNTDDLQFIVEKGEAAVSDADNAAAAQVLTQGAVMQEGKQAVLVMLSPAQHVKILDQSNTGADVFFKWQHSYPPEEPLVFETSALNTFSAAVKKYDVSNMTEFSLPGNKNTFYWRVYSKNEGTDKAVVGKVTIISAPVPRLLTPRLDQKYTYHTVPPPVRFLWEGNDTAASYLLEIGDNPEFKNPQFSRFTNTQSLTLSEFSEGTWYWRVTPRYLIDSGSEPKVSPTYFFHIEKTTDGLPAPELLFPQELTETAKDKGLTFAWKKIPEVKQYHLKIAKDEQMQTIITDVVLNEPHFKLTNSAQQLPNGEYYWTVAGIDINGIETAATQPVRFQTVDSESMLRSVFPPDGYVIADTLCQDIRFTWKTNNDIPKRFQVSASKDFSALTADIKVAGTGFEGISLPEGNWYWRLVSSHEASSIKTEPKQIVIAPPLKRPQLIDVGKTVVVFPEGKTAFAWTPVAGADYYQVRISKGYSRDIFLYENLFITDTKIELPLQNIAEGNYRISVQAFASPSITSTRRYGLAIDHDFLLKHVKRVELVYPGNGAVIDGMTAALEPFKFKWSSEVKPYSSRLTVRKSGMRKPVFEAVNPSTTVQAPPLEPGRYTWEMRATVVEGFDISSDHTFSFSVSPIPLLPPPSFNIPTSNAVLNAAFFKSNHQIDFEWLPVKKATHYRFSLHDAQGRVLFKMDMKADSDKPLLIFEDIAQLWRGNFYAEVKAQRRFENGKLFQDGSTARVDFRIDLPKERTVKTNETGILYGK